MRPSEQRWRGSDSTSAAHLPKNSTGTAVFAAKKTQPGRRDAGHASKFWNYGNFDDPHEVELYQKMLHETDPVKQKALLRTFEKHVLDDQANELFVLWQHRIVPHRAYVKGWKIGPSFYLNQDLATIWLDK